MEIEYALFTRRNFKYPQKQPTPHSCWDEEKQTLLKHFKNGADTIIGDLNGDHFFVFMEDNRPSTEEVDKYSTVEVAMNDLSLESMNNFYKNEKFVCESQTLSESGITSIIPQEATIDSLMFNPFGFSLNALCNQSYYTMHITPQKECSYVSYETNRETTDFDYLNIIRRVTETFTPEKYTVIDIRSKHFKDLLPSVEPTCEKLSKIEISKHFTLNLYSFVL
jgi:S-adenosylmethionine decarboxylase